MELVKIKDDRKALYMDLLLLADEEVRMIQKYLSRGEMFALRDGDLKALCVVTEEGSGVYEIKNFVTVPKYQRQGYGQRLISLIADHYKHLGKELYVALETALRHSSSTKNAAFKNRIPSRISLGSIMTTLFLKAANS